MILQNFVAIPTFFRRAEEHGNIAAEYHVRDFAFDVFELARMDLIEKAREGDPLELATLMFQRLVEVRPSLNGAKVVGLHTSARNHRAICLSLWHPSFPAVGMYEETPIERWNPDQPELPQTQPSELAAVARDYMVDALTSGVPGDEIDRMVTGFMEAYHESRMKEMEPHLTISAVQIAGCSMAASQLQEAADGEWIQVESPFIS